MIDGYLSTWKKYVQFSGRATRAEYWTFVLLNAVISIALIVLGGIFAAIEGLAILSSLFGLVLLVFSLAGILPSISVLVRRLHDTGKSGWWFFISFVPAVGSIILLILLLLDSQEGENEYNA